MKDKVLFITNAVYLDNTKNYGGVRLCTEEYIDLLKQKFDVVLFPVNYHINIKYRLLVKLNLNIYKDYRPEYYRKELTKIIKENNAGIVFLNLSNTASIARIIKEVFDEKVKVILCSHGNESGDYLHEITRFRKRIPFYKSFFSSYKLGRMLKKEAGFRQMDIDAVLTVSPVEEAIEKWIGAKKVLMIPRTIKVETLKRDPIIGRVGFLGDLSHWPNYYGVEELCKALSNIPGKNIELRLVGSPRTAGDRLAAIYSFVNYLGYLDKAELEAEVSSWAFFLNPVFYYSRGVSTKLAKAFGWGLPVITTSIGCRGYHWKKGNPIFAEDSLELAKKIKELSTDANKINEAAIEIQELVKSTASLEVISNDLINFLKSV